MNAVLFLLADSVREKKEKSEKRINLVKKMVLRMNLRGEVMQRFWIDCKKKAD